MLREFNEEEGKLFPFMECAKLLHEMSGYISIFDTETLISYQNRLFKGGS